MEFNYAIANLLCWRYPELKSEYTNILCGGHTKGNKQKIIWKVVRIIFPEGEYYFYFKKCDHQKLCKDIQNILFDDEFDHTKDISKILNMGYNKIIDN